MDPWVKASVSRFLFAKATPILFSSSSNVILSRRLEGAAGPRLRVTAGRKILDSAEVSRCSLRPRSPSF
jgi:hypothetical protein